MSEATEYPLGNLTREQELKRFRVETKEYAKKTKLDPSEVLFWEGKARKILDAYGSDFSKFVEGHETLVGKGEDLIKEIATTGFNVSLILEKDDFPFESEELLIFYNGHIDMPEHFGLLLAEMKKNRLISANQVRFSKKATEVIVGEWKEINLPKDRYIPCEEKWKRGRDRQNC